MKRINLRLINNTKDFLKFTSKPTYITEKIFGKDYAAIHEIKPVLILNTPIYVGFTVLDLHKWEIIENAIDKMKDEFGGVIVVEFVGLKSKMYSMKEMMVKNVMQQKE